MNKQALLKIVGPLVLALTIWIIKESPLFLVGEYPMLSAFLSMGLIVVSTFVILFAYGKKYEKAKWFGNLMIVVTLSSSGALFFGTYFTFKHYENAKSYYLSENGTLTKAKVTDKESWSVRRRGRKSTSYQVYFAFETKSGQQNTSWEVVTEDEFFAIREGQYVTIAYSEEKPELVELLLKPKKMKIYKAKLAEFDK